METAVPAGRVPVSTYRLQFNKDFGFKAASSIIPYLSELGISHVYASPFFKARPGSLHGYDIIDHNALNPEIGTEDDFKKYLETLQQHGMSQVLDIVPNHMCVECSDNIWWQDVLENGVGSLHAGFFDINWAPVKQSLTNKVLLPILGAQFGTILENQELRLTYEEGTFHVCYYEHKLPLSPKSYPVIFAHRMQELEQLLAEQKENLEDLQSAVTSFRHLPPDTETDATLVAERYREKEVAKRRVWKLYCDSPVIREFVDRNIEIFNGMPGEPSSFDLMEELLLQQSFRIAHWRVATEEINYRRFFDINALGAIRVELLPVFQEVHRFVLDLIADGDVAGLRVDHSDGLYNPVKYFHQLQSACFHKRLQQRGQDELDPNSELKQAMLQRYQDVLDSQPGFKPFYVVAEKIMLGTERMPADWSIHGETGYFFLNSLSHLFVEPGSFEALDSLYRSFTGIQQNFDTFLYEKKKLIMYSSMASEINTLGFHLSTIAQDNRHTWDFTLNSLVKTLVEIIAYFPVYRTYTNSLLTNAIDHGYIDEAVGRARRKSKAIDRSVFDFVSDVLTLNFFPDMEDSHKQHWLDFVMRFQQITGPVMAKGMEDTAFYLYNRLISLNEVGGNPEKFGLSLQDFHMQNRERVNAVPNGMLASSTHDTKRSEDVRARINVLTEMPEEWAGAVSRWSKNNRKHKKLVENDLVPNPNKEYHLYQTLVGAWPLNAEDTEEFKLFVERTRNYMLKVLREAKENTSWINPNEPYEQGVCAFVEEILADRTFLADMKMFQKQVALCGMYASLSMTLLKLTAPGIPDFYQGSELWDLRLVDPDNRQPVDFDWRKALLDDIQKMEREVGTAEQAGLLIESIEDGRPKLFLIHKLLQFRKSHEELFEAGDYDPVEVTGGRSDEVCAFARRNHDEEVIVVAPRFFFRLTAGGKRKPVGGVVWSGCRLLIPERDGCRYRDILTEAAHETTGGTLSLDAVLNIFPVAFLSRER